MAAEHCLLLHRDMLAISSKPRVLLYVEAAELEAARKQAMCHQAPNRKAYADSLQHSTEQRTHSAHSPTSFFARQFH